jgi:hypothetical protein
MMFVDVCVIIIRVFLNRIVVLLFLKNDELDEIITDPFTRSLGDHQVIHTLVYSWICIKLKSLSKLKLDMIFSSISMSICHSQ